MEGTESTGGNWLKYGCLGCLGFIALIILIVGGIMAMTNR